MMFVPYVCCGDPNLEFSYQLIKKLAPYSTIIELGIPFSDPIADGKTIQMAANRALKNGVTVEKIFAMIKLLRKEGIKTPFVFMTYYNIVYSYGKEKFLERITTSSVQGIIIPDLPFEEDPEFENLAEKHGIGIVKLIAPNTEEKRAKKILTNEKLFTYLVSTTGTTGAKREIGNESLDFVKRIRKLAGNDKKLYVGFGISNAAQAKEIVNAGADGVIIGSRIIDIYSKFIGTDGEMTIGAIEQVEKFVKEIKGAEND
ncbi:MAG: tryptophan synthase subunit alpha [Candidatus Micrarchaeota archaeon]|nr:tryptophan synthase subunit alpha [Candidatus Micrarchaeota archaeon]